MIKINSRVACVIAFLLTGVATMAQPGRIKPPTKPQTKTTTKTPKSAKPTTGTLTITSTPADAVIKIDGEYMGTTPLTLKNRKAGTYSITFSAEGYETQTQDVTVTAGKTATCSATLKKKQVQQPVVQQSVQQQQEQQQPIEQQPIQQPIQQQTLQEWMSEAVQIITANGVSFKMIRVEGGTFTMGATPEQGRDASNNEKPAHQVKLSTYYIGETEVTQELWQAVMGSNPSKFKGANRPVEQVSWDDCKTFINRLNSLTGKTFRLPTEAEWEFAARGGNKSQGYKYSGSNTFGNVAWYKYNNSEKKTQPVKTKLPNELSIYDMSGNVWEWCQDWYDSYNSSTQTNPKGPSSGWYLVFRGGSWNGSARDCRVSFRRRGTPGSRRGSLGMRLVL